MTRQEIVKGVGAPTPGHVRIGIDMGRGSFGAVAPLDAETILTDLAQATAHFPNLGPWLLVHATPTRLEFEAPDTRTRG
ncbi:hypothetical protein [Microbacterium phage MO526]|uniref:Uncharacterized protein n=1 Tax=Microbacterium phage MO526 TaxID=3108092 RepID=A0ABZ0ZXA3_9CAUD|nr:hypothetical protein [Microbacterium phage MO526]